MTVKPFKADEFDWKEFQQFCHDRNIGRNLWEPWWTIWKVAYTCGQASKNKKELTSTI